MKTQKQHLTPSRIWCCFVINGGSGPDTQTPGAGLLVGDLDIYLDADKLVFAHRNGKDSLAGAINGTDNSNNLIDGGLGANICSTIAALQEIVGFGNVDRLYQAMARYTSVSLQVLSGVKKDYYINRSAA